MNPSLSFQFAIHFNQSMYFCDEYRLTAILLMEFRYQFKKIPNIEIKRQKETLMKNVSVYTENNLLFLFFKRIGIQVLVYILFFLEGPAFIFKQMTFYCLYFKVSTSPLCHLYLTILDY